MMTVTELKEALGKLTFGEIIALRNAVAYFAGESIYYNGKPLNWEAVNTRTLDSAIAKLEEYCDEQDEQYEYEELE